MLKMFPMAKPKWDQSLCESETPIEIIGIISKIAEAVVRNRILEQVGPLFGWQQYAFTRARSAGTHLLELYYFTREVTGRRRYVYFASVDVGCALDRALRSP